MQEMWWPAPPVIISELRVPSTDIVVTQPFADDPQVDFIRGGVQTVRNCSPIWYGKIKFRLSEHNTIIRRRGWGERFDDQVFDLQHCMLSIFTE